jgi:tRNA(Ile)-lysidine synthase
MLKQIIRTIETHAMLAQGDHVVVAVSGGPDSVALLHVLVRLTDAYRLRLTVAHLNHGLRGAEADGDEVFVRDLASGLGIPWVSRKADISRLRSGKGRSLEEIGREERYRFLQETAAACGAARIALGHHRDDQAETILLNLIRGSGTEGLCGMPPVRDGGRIIRPLLEVGREEIVAFLSRQGAGYRTDSSNRDSLFLRNRVRNGLMPLLQREFNPRLGEGLSRTAGILRREEGYLQGVLRDTLESWGIHPGCREAVVPLERFERLHEALQARAVKWLLEEVSALGQGFTCRHVEAVLGLSRHRQGYASLDLPARVRVLREGGALRFRQEGENLRRAQPAPAGFQYAVAIPGTVHLREIGRTVRLEWADKPDPARMGESPGTVFMDYDAMRPPLTLRSMRPGDRVAPLGLGGTKKLQDYFVDRRIPRSLRGQVPLLADARSILWIVGGQISEGVRVTGGTQRVVRAQILP